MVVSGSFRSLMAVQLSAWSTGAEEENARRQARTIRVGVISSESNAPYEDESIVAASLAFKQRHHVRGGQWDSARVNSGGVEKSSGDGRRTHGIGAFRAAAEAFVIA